MSSISMHSHVGELHRGDMLVWEHNGSKCVGKAELFLEIHRGDALVHFCFCKLLHTCARANLLNC